MPTLLKKPVRRTATVVDRPHGVAPKIVITLHPGGTIALREHRRRKELSITVGKLYTQLLLAEVRATRAAKKGRRHAR